MAQQDGSQHLSHDHPAQQLNTQIFAAICFLSLRPSWARLTPPGPRNAGICSCLKHTSANSLACSKKEEMGERQHSALLAFVFCWAFLLFCFFFLKEGSLLLPLSFCSCSVWKVLLQLALVTGKRASSSQQNKGAVSFFFYSRVLRKAFFQGGCRGKAGARSLGKPPATTRAQEMMRTKKWWGFGSACLGGTWEREEPGKGGQDCRGGEQHPTGHGRTIALPSKNLRWCLGLGLAPGMLCQAGAWVSPRSSGPAQKCQEAIVGVPGCLLMHGHAWTCMHEGDGRAQGREGDRICPRSQRGLSELKQMLRLLRPGPTF